MREKKSYLVLKYGKGFLIKRHIMGRHTNLMKPSELFGKKMSRGKRMYQPLAGKM